MALFKLKANSEVDMLTPGELHEALTQHVGKVQNWFQEMARGFTTARFVGYGTVANNVVSIPSPGDRTIGPSNGFAWAVQRISCFGLGATDVINVFRNDTTPANYIGAITAINPYHPGEKGLILRGDEVLIFDGTGLADIVNGSTLVVNGEALEVSELDLYKVL